MYDLKDRVAIVTGAGRKSGIGAAVARRLAQDGAHVVMGDICAPPTDLPHAGSGQWEELTAIAEEIESRGVRSLPVRVDVTDAGLVQAMVAQTREVFGRLDILVNNAGAAIGPAPVVQMAEEAWRRTLEINATGTFLCSKYALPLMIEGGRGGRIINMSSLAAERPKPYVSAYAASKAAIVALTRSLAQEVAEYGITVNAVLPGDVDTALKQWGLQVESSVTGQPYDDVLSSRRGGADTIGALGDAGRGGRPGRFPSFGRGQLHHRSGLQHHRRPRVDVMPTKSPLRARRGLFSQRGGVRTQVRPRKLIAQTNR